MLYWEGRKTSLKTKKDYFQGESVKHTYGKYGDCKIKIWSIPMVFDPDKLPHPIHQHRDKK